MKIICIVNGIHTHTKKNFKSEETTLFAVVKQVNRLILDTYTYVFKTCLSSLQNFLPYQIEISFGAIMPL